MDSSRADDEHIFKVLCIGDVGCGKTCTVRRFVFDTFSLQTKATLGVDYALKTVTVKNDDTIAAASSTPAAATGPSSSPLAAATTASSSAGGSGGTRVTLQLWDIAGQERSGQMTRVYYQNAHGVVVLFDVTREDTLRSALAWKRDLDNRVTAADGSPLPAVLVGNKMDLVGHVLPPSYLDLEARVTSAEHGFTDFVAASALDGRNVTLAFEKLVKGMLKTAAVRPLPPSPTNKSSIRGEELARRSQKGEANEKRRKCAC
eukprot:PhM_4_TR6174/c0_g1_i1/m.48084/K07918/RAB32; Ras-related protein Rab-32